MIYPIEFKIMVTKVLTEVRRAMHEHCMNFNKDIENIKKYQTEIIELNLTIIKLKISIEGFNSRLN